MTGSSLRRLAAVVSGTLVAAAVAVSMAPAASAAPDVAIVSQSTYVDSIGDRNIVGEVQNKGTGNVEGIVLSFVFFDAANTQLGTDSTPALVDRLAPGEISPFHETFTPPAGYNRYTVTVSASDVNQDPNHNFTTVITGDTTDAEGAFRTLAGTVRNNNSSPADFVKVVFTFYNAGKIVNAAADVVNDDTIPADGESQIQIAVNGPTFTSYLVLAQSASQGTGNPSPAPSSSQSPAPGPSPTAVEVAPTLSLSPSIINAGQRTTVTYQGKPNATLDIYSKTQPATDYSRIAAVTLDANGMGTSSHAPTKNTRILAKTASGLASTNPLIQVRSVASLSATRVGTRTFTFSGRVYPALSGRLVSLYRNGVLVAQARCASTGIYTMTKTLGAGTFSFQTKTANDTYNLGTTSPLRSVRVY